MRRLAKFFAPMFAIVVPLFPDYILYFEARRDAHVSSEVTLKISYAEPHNCQVFSFNVDKVIYISESGDILTYEV